MSDLLASVENVENKNKNSNKLDSENLQVSK